MRPRLLFLFATFLLAPSGCGLSDYHERMEAQRKRVAAYAAKNRLLDDPIVRPRIADKTGDKTVIKPAWPFEVFLRLPRGFSTAPRESTPYNKPFPCFRYYGSDQSVNILLAGAGLADPKSEQDDKNHKYYRTHFRFWVRKAIEEFYAKTTKVSREFDEKAVVRRVEKQLIEPYPGASPLRIKYEHLTYTDKGMPGVKLPVVFDVYFHEAARRQFAIVIQYPATQSNPAFHERMDACLSTLDIGYFAGKRRTEYLQMAGKTP